MKRAILFLILFTSVFVYSQRPEMVLVEGGTFIMGGSGSGSMDEMPEHEVTVNDFYMAKYEVTFDDFDLFCQATGYKKLNDGNFGRGKLPAINICWKGAIFYCNWMSSRFNLDKVYDIKVDSSGLTILNINWDANGFRLPTEAEWEYAARGGKSGRNMGDLVEFAWFAENSDNMPHEVGTLKPNSLGIYDISGNAYEWCWDYYDPKYYSNSPKDNPKGPEKGKNRIYRGGYFNAVEDFMIVSRRFNLEPTINDGQIGIRLVQSNQ
ncbi:MAG: SUMF1/EgtB/PvdO family nonheme iron enzyme [Bacteroidales bacterium]|nr:SUMF1/EgtB/PvdO family nonheme iron enzyme [Bacteroidales bacterium]